MNIRNGLLGVIGLLLVVAATNRVVAEPVATGWLNRTAIGGHDTTAYYDADKRREQRTLMGEKRFMVRWQGADWWFASQASADRFASDPARYRPAYNGFCSNGLSLGEGLIPTDGRVWEFFGDRLHLFYAERGRQRWLNGEWRRYAAQADRAWRSLNRFGAAIEGD